MTEAREAVPPPVLAGRGLRCERGGRVLFRDLDFALRRGQILKVEGGNGAGKTTLLRILCGLHADYQGQVLWRGRPAAEGGAAALYVGHRIGVSRVLTPLENLEWLRGLHGGPGGAAIEEALAAVGLGPFAETPCRALSAGQQRRVSLARLLLSPARLWVLDEPFTTLDAAGARQLEGMLADHAAAGGAAVVTTHHALSAPDAVALTLGGEDGRP